MECVKRSGPASEIRYQAFRDGRVEKTEGRLAMEVPLEVAVNGRSHSLLMQTPGAETELVVGYLHTENLIDRYEDIKRLDLNPGPEVLGLDGLRADALLPHIDAEGALPERPSISLASCGMCGKEDLEKACTGMDWIKSKQKFRWPVIHALLKDLRSHQPLYKLTRGVHAAAIYDADGNFVICREDVGRHNAMDKIIGRCLMDGVGFADKLVLLSGRASLEMVLKTARAGIPLLLCFSNPTILAVEAAKALNLTLVGRLEDKHLAGYTHTRRLVE